MDVEEALQMFSDLDSEPESPVELSVEPVINFLEGDIARSECCSDTSGVVSDIFPELGRISPVQLSREGDLIDPDPSDSRDAIAELCITSEPVAAAIGSQESIETGGFPNNPASATCHDDNNFNSRSRKRKRVKHQDEWARTIRKRKRQAGLPYTDARGKDHCARTIKIVKDCETKCRFRCSHMVSSSDREDIAKHFWSLTDNEKNVFYGSTTERRVKERSRTDSTSSRRKFSYFYYFQIDGAKIRVCRQFYLSTLDISEKRISLFHAKSADPARGIDDQRGKNVKNATSSTVRERIMQHIASFPRIPSHYCRSTTKREYLEPHLSVAKMYSLYEEWCRDHSYESVKINVYRDVFNTKFNLGFHIPKKDKCDACEEFEAFKRNTRGAVSEEILSQYQEHQNDKHNTREHRNLDRQANKTVVTFDMENVITLPKSNISNFFYKRKLTVFNLTGHCSVNKKAYNAVWDEHLYGRDGNAIASALCRILDAVCVDLPDTTELTLWSDSCVPQNRNSHMLMALKLFMKSHPSITKIEQKFSTPGHSCVQEVDNIHSHNQRALSISEVFSPIGLIRLLSSVRPYHSKVMQMRSEDFRNYQKASTNLKFKKVPFTQIKHVVVSSAEPTKCAFKTRFSDAEFTTVTLTPYSQRKSTQIVLKEAQIARKPSKLSKEKIADIVSMMKWMPLVDKNFYEVIFHMKHQRI